MNISVVIPAYQARATVIRAIDSVVAQTFPVHEIVVVDDGSPDRLGELVERVANSRIRLFRQRNQGAAAARNTGVQEATGDWIAFLDADDYWEVEKLQSQRDTVVKYPQLDMLASRFYEQQPDSGRLIGTLRPQDRSFYDRPLSASGEFAFRAALRVWTGTVLVRRELAVKHPFVSGLEPAEDRDCWVRIIRDGQIYLSEKPLATAVLEPGSISRSNIAKDCGNMLRVVERNQDSLGFWGTRRWRSHTLFRWAANEPDTSLALSKLASSFVAWPLPYGIWSRTPPLARLRRLAVLLRGSSLGRVR